MRPLRGAEIERFVGFYKHLAPNGAKTRVGDRWSINISCLTARNQITFPQIRRRSRELRPRMRFPSSYCVNSDVNKAPPRFTSTAVIFSTLRESLAIQTVCLSASFSAETISSL